MEKVYNLKNRDGLNVYLKLIEGSEYELVVEASYDVAFTVSPDGNEYFYIDPPGGPMIVRGSTLLEYPKVTVEKIYHNKEYKAFVCILKDDEQDNNEHSDI